MALAFALAAIPVLGQEGPESLLPPGFDQPVAPETQPSRAPDGPPQPRPTQSGGAIVQPLPTASASATPSPTPSASPTPVDPALLAEYELPSYARRPLDYVGVGGVDGVAPDAWGRADGVFLEALMRRLEVPVASRWLSIALRRHLMAESYTPRNVNGSDWAAERAWLLVRMGEANAARAVVQSVDTENFTPKMLQVAMQAALATGDPAAVCPVADQGRATLAEGGWALAQAICSALACAQAAITTRLRTRCG